MTTSRFIKSLRLSDLTFGTNEYAPPTLMNTTFYTTVSGGDPIEVVFVEGPAGEIYKATNKGQECPSLDTLTTSGVEVTYTMNGDEFWCSLDDFLKVVTLSKPIPINIFQGGYR